MSLLFCYEKSSLALCLNTLFLSNFFLSILAFGDTNLEEIKVKANCNELNWKRYSVYPDGRKESLGSSPEKGYWKIYKVEKDTIYLDFGTRIDFICQPFQNGVFTINGKGELVKLSFQKIIVPTSATRGSNTPSECYCDKSNYLDKEYCKAFISTFPNTWTNEYKSNCRYLGEYKISKAKDDNYIAFAFNFPMKEDTHIEFVSEESQSTRITDSKFFNNKKFYYSNLDRSNKHYMTLQESTSCSNKPCNSYDLLESYNYDKLNIHTQIVVNKNSNAYLFNQHFIYDNKLFFNENLICGFDWLNLKNGLIPYAKLTIGDKQYWALYDEKKDGYRSYFLFSLTENEFEYPYQSCINKSSGPTEEEIKTATPEATIELPVVDLNAELKEKQFWGVLDSRTDDSETGEHLIKAIENSYEYFEIDLSIMKLMLFTDGKNLFAKKSSDDSKESYTPLLDILKAFEETNVGYEIIKVNYQDFDFIVKYEGYFYSSPNGDKVSLKKKRTEETPVNITGFKIVEGEIWLHFFIQEDVDPAHDPDRFEKEPEFKPILRYDGWLPLGIGTKLNFGKTIIGC